MFLFTTRHLVQSFRSLMDYLYRNCNEFLCTRFTIMPTTGSSF